VLKIHRVGIGTFIAIYFVEHMKVNCVALKKNWAIRVAFALREEVRLALLGRSG